MYDRDTYFDPTGVSREAFRQLAADIYEEMKKRSVQFDHASELLRQFVSARVRLKLVEPHLQPNILALLAATEIEDLGRSIRSYQFIERYYFAFEGLSKEMSAAFMQHIYNLRHAEVYLIKEKSVKLLAFLHEAARNFGILTPSQTKNFIKDFNRIMEFRLRVRHRTTHAHEPPGVADRALGVFSMLSGLEGQEELKLGIEVVGSAMLEANSPFPNSLGKDPTKFLSNYLREADEEAREMWSLVERSVRSTMNIGVALDQRVQT